MNLEEAEAKLCKEIDAFLARGGVLVQGITQVYDKGRRDCRCALGVLVDVDNFHGFQEAAYRVFGWTADEARYFVHGFDKNASSDYQSLLEEELQSPFFKLGLKLNEKYQPALFRELMDTY